MGLKPLKPEDKKPLEYATPTPAKPDRYVGLVYASNVFTFATVASLIGTMLAFGLAWENDRAGIALVYVWIALPVIATMYGASQICLAFHRILHRLASD